MKNKKGRWWSKHRVILCKKNLPVLKNKNLRAPELSAQDRTHPSPPPTPLPHLQEKLSGDVQLVSVQTNDVEFLLPTTKLWINTDRSMWTCWKMFWCSLDADSANRSRWSRATRVLCFVHKNRKKPHTRSHVEARVNAVEDAADEFGIGGERGTFPPLSKKNSTPSRSGPSSTSSGGRERGANLNTNLVSMFFWEGRYHLPNSKPLHFFISEFLICDVFRVLSIIFCWLHMSQLFLVRLSSHHRLDVS